jgi:hypothetical protein
MRESSPAATVPAVVPTLRPEAVPSPVTCVEAMVIGSDPALPCDAA